MDLGKRINVNNYLELTARLRATGVAGIIFDHYSATEYKFVALDVPGQRLLIGHTNGTAPGSSTTRSRARWSPARTTTSSSSSAARL